MSTARELAEECYGKLPWDGEGVEEQIKVIESAIRKAVAQTWREAADIVGDFDGFCYETNTDSFQQAKLASALNAKVKQLKRGD